MDPSSDGEDASVNGSLIWRCSRCTGLNIKEVIMRKFTLKNAARIQTINMIQYDD